MSIIKELIKAPIERKLYTEYFMNLEYSYFSYNDFALARESAIVNSFSVDLESANARVKIVSYDDVSDFNFADVSEEYVLFVSDVSGLDKYACQAVVEFFQDNADACMVYGDEDEYNNNETVRMNPWFKPAWSPDTLLDYFYLGNAVALRKEVLETVPSTENIYELILKLALEFKRNSVGHIDYCLYHSHYLKKLFCDTSFKNLKKNYSDKFSVNSDEDCLVSIIIPSKDNPDILRKCITSIIRYSKGFSYEIIVVDNGSNDNNKRQIECMLDELKQDLVSCEYVDNLVENPLFSYLYKPQPFNFSRMCNQGAKASQGNFLLFLNDDVEVREGKWLEKMLEVARRKHSGAVGAKLYYPNSMMIQHAGITNLRLGPVHKLQFKDDNAHYYMDLNNGVRNCLAVTGACLLVDRAKFEEVGGFCEELEVAFNDVDLCFRLHEAGYYNAVCNNTHLWHYESLSRGEDASQEKLTRLTEERNLLYERHQRLYGVDPYYSDCLSTDILDTNYSFIYEYDYRDVIQDAIIVPFKKAIKENWYNECLMVSLEYAGDFDKYENIKNKSQGYALIGGYAFVAGSDNSGFRRKIILSGEKNSFAIDAKAVYRPDLEVNLDPEEYALMTGFCIKINMKNLPADNYRIGILAESGSSRLKLYKETNKYIKVNTK